MANEGGQISDEEAKRQIAERTAGKIRNFQRQLASFNGAQREEVNRLLDQVQARSENHLACVVRLALQDLKENGKT
jgi:hypothetical protein